MRLHTAALTATTLLGPAATAGVTIFASSVESFDQGRLRDSSHIDIVRSNPLNALNAPQMTYDMNYVSLGWRGSIVLSFGGLITEQVTVWETSINPPPGHYEMADIYVGYGDSAANADWWYAGSVDSRFDGQPISLDGASSLAGRDTFSYVRVTDATPDTSASMDGFDVDGVGATYAPPPFTPVPVPAPAGAALLGLGGLAAGRRSRNVR
ncbi:MAG: hypothetical protein CMJ31_06865 [Phycisphaerae bacterium]|nr:hypothetical protein [Phycisphaerae bacterium]